MAHREHPRRLAVLLHRGLGTCPVRFRAHGRRWPPRCIARAFQHRSLPPASLPCFAAIAAGPHGDGTTRQPGRRGGAGRVGAVRRVRRPRAAPARRDPAVLAAGARACGGDAAVAARVAAAWSQPWSPAGPPGAWRGGGPGAPRRGPGPPPAASPSPPAVIPMLARNRTPPLALLLYPG